jgi:hypothetical protein
VRRPHTSLLILFFMTLSLYRTVEDSSIFYTMYAICNAHVTLLWVIEARVQPPSASPSSTRVNGRHLPACFLQLFQDQLISLILIFLEEQRLFSSVRFDNCFVRYGLEMIPLPLAPYRRVIGGGIKRWLTLNQVRGSRSNLTETDK